MYVCMYVCMYLCMYVCILYIKQGVIITLFNIHVYELKGVSKDDKKSRHRDKDRDQDKDREHRRRDNADDDRKHRRKEKGIANMITVICQRNECILSNML